MYENEHTHKKFLCPGVLKITANSLDQRKGSSQLPEITALVGASNRIAGLLKV